MVACKEEPRPPLPEPVLLRVLEPIQFGALRREFVTNRVRGWATLQSAAALGLLVDALVPNLDGTQPRGRRTATATIFEGARGLVIGGGEVR